MNIEVKHFGRILPNGNISFYNNEMWQEQRQSLAGKEIELTIKEKFKRPTVSQFSYYWGGILGTCLTCECFNHYATKEELHKEVFAPMFLGYQVRVIVGKKKWDKQMVKSLSELTKKETSEFIENVINFCVEQDVIILPSEQYIEKYYKEVTIKQ